MRLQFKENVRYGESSWGPLGMPSVVWVSGMGILDGDLGIMVFDFGTMWAHLLLIHKSQNQYEVRDCSNFNFDSATGIVGDHIIRLTGYKSKMAYPKELRLVESLDPDSGEVIQFLANIIDQLELNGLEIANIYRHRWDIESFFKLIKQNLTV